MKENTSTFSFRENPIIYYLDLNERQTSPLRCRVVDFSEISKRKVIDIT